MQSNAKTPQEYIHGLPKERQHVIQQVREVILRHLPNGYQEVMQYGMIGYVVPLDVYPAGYLNKKDTALPYAGLASQKNYCSLYILTIYQDSAIANWFMTAYQASGKKLDMGKACIRFKRAQDLALDVIGEAIAKTSVKQHIANYEKARNKRT